MAVCARAALSGFGPGRAKQPATSSSVATGKRAVIRSPAAGLFCLLPVDFLGDILDARTDLVLLVKRRRGFGRVLREFVASDGSWQPAT
jgi:hypothetical protein